MELSFSTFLSIPPSTSHDELPSIRSVPFTRGQGPNGRLTGVFGIKDTLALMQEARRAAYMISDIQIVRVDLSLTVRDVPTSQLWLKALPDTDYLHIPRARLDLIQHICDRLNLKESRPDHLSQAINVKPELLNTLWALPEFAHIKCFVWASAWSVTEAPAPGLRLCASVRNIDDIDSVKIWNYPDAHPGFEV